MAKISIKKKGPVEYPPDHKPGMRVTKGGSCCANCRFWDGTDCENKYYRQWSGTENIPVSDPETYCSDWWEPRTASNKLPPEDEEKENKG